MRNYYLLFVIFFPVLLNAQIVNIPDANFKAKLLAASVINTIASTQISVSGDVFSYDVIDTNGDGEIQVSEAEAIVYLDVSNANISDLTGFEQFSNLRSLKCNGNQLTTLNISQNTTLESLECSNNLLPSIDISQNAALKFFDCSNNRLTNINVSSNTGLIGLWVSGNQLSNLDVSQNVALTILGVSNNQFSNLDITQNVALIGLDCAYNQLTSLNISQNTALVDLECAYNQIVNLDVTQNNSLERLKCDHNQISNLSFAQNSSLYHLYCPYNQLINLDVSQNFMLTELICNNNQLMYLDISNNPNLDYLLCYTNQLIAMNIKNGNMSWNNLGFNNNYNLQYICADEEDVQPVQQKASLYGFYNCHVNSYCSFTPGGTFYEISGNSKLDLNNNGCDVLDSIYPSLRLNITNETITGSVISNQTGNYYTPFQEGNYTITPNLENPSYFNIFPTSFTVDFPIQTSPFNQDFCVTANGVKSDVEIVLLPITPARPGFDADYKLVYRNKGNQIENGSVSLTFDDTRLDYVAANPIYNTTAINSFTWNYTNLQPFESREIDLILNVNSPMETPAVNNGDILNYTATITTANTDETPTDNTFTLDQIVVGSYDPNDKTCLEGTTITPSEVGKYVHYLIRFENTGTFPAENIVVKDMIDLAKFDIATLVPLKSSHDFYTRINGNKVEFIFENINLDFNDATNDGYVVFKIKTKPTLVLGDTFTNNANIYFDYNFPITTNTYTTTITALSSQDFEFGTYFTLYPNPVKDVLNIQIKQDLEVNSIEIYNQLGQIVMATTNAINSVDVTNLASGTYFVKINTEKGSANAKFVKE